LIDEKAFETVLPSVVTSTIQTAAISATMMPYSTMVAPDSSRSNSDVTTVILLGLEPGLKGEKTAPASFLLNRILPIRVLS